MLPVCDKPYHKIKENMPLGGGGLKICGTTGIYSFPHGVFGRTAALLTDKRVLALMCFELRSLLNILKY